MINRIITFLIILLLVFTPIAFGSVDLWSFSLLELTVLIILLLWTSDLHIDKRRSANDPDGRHWKSDASISWILVLLYLFLGVIFLQMIPLPSGLVKLLDPKVYDIRHSLAIPGETFSFSLMPFATKITFLKWFALIGFFTYLTYSRLFDKGFRSMGKFIVAILSTGVLESVYGMFEFFSGHRHILNVEASDRISSVTGTYFNRNCLAGYFLMVIPISIGFLLARNAMHRDSHRSFRSRLVSLDGKDILIGFGVIIVIGGLILSASRMGIASLFLSITLISLLTVNRQQGKKFQRLPILILAISVLWAIWIGIDVALSRFLNTSPNDFEFRWSMWVDTYRIFRDFPLLGTGLGTFSNVFPMYRSLHILPFVNHAENDCLQLLSEAGIIGAGLLLTVFIWLFVKSLGSIRSLSNTDPERYIGMGGLVGIVALMLHSLVEKNLQVPANAFLYTFLWGMVVRIALRR